MIYISPKVSELLKFPGGTRKKGGEGKDGHGGGAAEESLYCN